MSPEARGFAMGASSAVAMAAVLLTASSQAGDDSLLGQRAALGLSEVDRAESTLTTATVKDRRGAELGRVHGVTRGADGEIKTVQVTMAAGGEGPADDERIIVLDARGAIYLPQSNEIRTSVTRAQARTMPQMER